jgi:hypothetical protein
MTNPEYIVRFNHLAHEAFPSTFHQHHEPNLAFLAQNVLLEIVWTNHEMGRAYSPTCLSGWPLSRHEASRHVPGMGPHETIQIYREASHFHFGRSVHSCRSRWRSLRRHCGHCYCIIGKSPSQAFRVGIKCPPNGLWQCTPVDSLHLAKFRQNRQPYPVGAKLLATAKYSGSMVP